MKAILVNDDKSLSWSEVRKPVPAPDQILIKVNYAALNRADLMQRDGNYPPPPGAPEWMGLEVSGRVCEIGEEAEKLSSLSVGDKVCALLGGGGYAEYAAVRHDMAVPIPGSYTLAEAATIPEAFCTSWLNLFVEGKAKAGDTLLITGGNSGLASAAIPLAKAFGLRVITTVRGSRAAESVKDLGADVIVDTESRDLASALKEQLESGSPADIAIDCVGGENMGKCLPYMARGGRWIMIAALAGSLTEIDLKNIYVRNIRIIGSTLRSRPEDVKASLMREIAEKVYPKMDSGEIRPSIYRVLPIQEADKAHQIMRNGGHKGKILLEVEHE